MQVQPLECEIPAIEVIEEKCVDYMPPDGVRQDDVEEGNAAEGPLESGSSSSSSAFALVLALVLALFLALVLALVSTNHENG